MKNQKYQPVGRSSDQENNRRKKLPKSTLIAHTYMIAHLTQ